MLTAAGPNTKHREARDLRERESRVSSGAMGAKLQRYFIPVVIGFAPLMLFLLNWRAEHMSTTALVLRDLTLPVLAAEIFTVFAALREGMLASWRELRPPRVALAALGILLAIAWGTALLVAPNGYVAGIRIVGWTVHLAFGFSIAFLCGRLFGPGDLVAAYLAGFAGLAIAFVIFAAGALHRPFQWTWDLPSFSHIRHLGIYATPMIAFAIGIMATAQRWSRWAIALAIAATGFGLALWTGSRGPVLAIGCAVIAGILVCPAGRRIPALGGALLALAIAYAVVAQLPVPADNMGAGRTIAATQGGDMLTGRSELWRMVSRAIAERPLFGYGDGQMNSVAHFYGMAQPHNLVLQILLAWGVAGLMCCLLLGYAFARVALPAVRNDEAELLSPFLAMVALTALSMVDAALYHILPVSIFAACAGIIVASRGPARAS
jgi:O-antigen ligase